MGACDDAGVDQPDRVAREAAAMLRRLLDGEVVETQGAGALRRPLEPYGAGVFCEPATESTALDAPDGGVEALTAWAS